MAEPVPAIIDMGTMRKGGQQRLVADFLDEALRAQPGAWLPAVVDHTAARQAEQGCFDGWRPSSKLRYQLYAACRRRAEDGHFNTLGSAGLAFLCRPRSECDGIQSSC